MTLEDYLQKKTDEIAQNLADNAPLDSCTDCDVCEGRLSYTGKVFQYECRICGKTWPAERLEIDDGGKFLVVDFAD